MAPGRLTSSRRITILILVAFAFCVAVWQVGRPRPMLFKQVHGPGELHVHTMSTGEMTFALMPGAFYSLKFDLPEHYRDAAIKGVFAVAKRNASAIRAFVLNAEDFASWQKGYTTYRFYDSGDVQHADVDVPLRVWSNGTYYVVFQNPAGAREEAYVNANFKLIYSTLWFPGMQD